MAHAGVWIFAQPLIAAFQGLPRNCLLISMDSLACFRAVSVSTFPGADRLNPPAISSRPDLKGWLGQLVRVGNCA